MKQKKSSFQMGNQFNGYGNKVYIKADTVITPPVPQGAAKLTPDYSHFALKAIGASPVVLDANNHSDALNRMLGAMPVVNQVDLEKNEKGDGYVGKITVAMGESFVNSSYPINKGAGKEAVSGTVPYFVITSSTGLSIRDGRSSSATVLGSVGMGEELQALTENGRVIEMPDDDSGTKSTWLKVTNGTVTGWVSSAYVREDKVNVIELAKYGLNKEIKVEVVLKDKTVLLETGVPSRKWPMIGEGQYDHPCQKRDGKWLVAVGPAILDPLYPDRGKCEADDIKAFSKCIKARLRPKTAGDRTDEDIEIECLVCDIKAHSFRGYPYPDSTKIAGNESRYISDTVASATITPSIPSGMIQTGIRYPNASNDLVVGSGKPQENNQKASNIDFSVIEFCGNGMEDKYKKLYDNCELISITTNYEKNTRGKLYTSKGGEWG